jgi:hypothetical protein
MKTPPKTLYYFDENATQNVSVIPLWHRINHLNCTSPLLCWTRCSLPWSWLPRTFSQRESRTLGSRRKWASRGRTRAGRKWLFSEEPKKKKRGNDSNNPPKRPKCWVKWWSHKSIKLPCIAWSHTCLSCHSCPYVLLTSYLRQVSYIIIAIHHKCQTS